MPSNTNSSRGGTIESKTEKLFVYGIFLGERQRQSYGMENPQYATVPKFITVGSHIVQAVEVAQNGVALTGLLVDMPVSGWTNLDGLEGGYKRVKVTTTTGTDAYMYVSQDNEREDFSTFKKGAWGFIHG